MTECPQRSSYDVVIIGGALYGSAIAWFLARDVGFDGSVLVIEMDPTYAFASTSHTNSCIRQQFSHPVNVRISQFGAEFIKNFRDYIGMEDAPEITLQPFGYMFLAGNDAYLAALREAQEMQVAHGAGTQLMSREDIAAAYPFYQLEDIVGGTHNRVDEGYFDGGTMFDWFRRAARVQGAEFVTAEVTAIEQSGSQVTGVTLRDGTRIACGKVVNASGPRARLTAQMAGIDLPVEPRKRYTYVIDAERPLKQTLPLTVDPSGVHFRSDGRYYMVGCAPEEDGPVDYDDFTIDHGLWERHTWPIVASRIPQFEAVKVVNMWVGHYAYNTVDQNALLGFDGEVSNYLHCNGFSGHGLQQAPAVARGMVELMMHGRYTTLDLSPLDAARRHSPASVPEYAII